MTPKPINLTDIERDAVCICKFAKRIELVLDDYDEYGSRQYLVIEGECADLIIKELDDNAFKCRVIPYGMMECVSPAFEYYHPSVQGGMTVAKHSYMFRLKTRVVDSVLFTCEEIRVWLNLNKKYLTASSTLFERIDIISYPDLRGKEVWGNGILSSDRFLVSDEDFYIDMDIKETRRTLL